MIRKLFFAIAWLGILCVSLMGVYLAIFPEIGENFVFNDLFFRAGLIVVSIFYILMFLEKFLMNFERSKDYQVSTENGKISVSSSSINNLVKEVMATSYDLKNIRTKNKLKGKKVKIFITVDSYSDSEISKNIEKLQGKVKEEVYEFLGIEVHSVEVKIAKLLRRKGNQYIPERGEV